MIAQILLSLMILVGLHEFGHLIAAKMFGMRVEKFSIGFPPKIFGFKFGETEYAISAIPLGGFVKISGMIDESLDTEAMKEEPKDYEFRAKPAWQRLIVMLGGIIVNVILGISIFVLMTYFLGTQHLTLDTVNNNGGIHAGTLAQEIGLETGDRIINVNNQPVEYLGDAIAPDVFLADEPSYQIERNGALLTKPIPSGFLAKLNDKENASQFITTRASNVIGLVPEDEKKTNKSLANVIGLKAGDQFIEMDGQPIQYFDEVQHIVSNFSKDTLRFTIQRGEEQLSFANYFPSYNNKIGFYPASQELETKVINYSFGESISKGTNDAFGIVFLQIKAFGKMFKGELDPRKSLGGPIAIAKTFGGKWIWERFWRLTGLLSMVLAFMNLLPIPALDGGHVVFLTMEMISGRKPSDKFLEGAQKVGMIILLLLMVFIFGNDIVNLFN